jgi:hypothetical protein
MILPDPTALRAQLENATRQLEAEQVAWQQYGCQLVTECEASATHQRVESLRGQLAQLDDREYRERRLQLFFQRGRQLLAGILRLESLDGCLAAMLIATFPCAAAAIVLAVLGLKLWITFPLLALVFLSCSVLARRYLLGYDRSKFSKRRGSLAEWVRARSAAIAAIKIDLASAEKALERCNLLCDLRKRYEAAVQECKRLRDLLTNRRYGLLKYDWRSLRGVPFEEFLFEVFTELGYSVQRTKTSGDQGVDLLLERKGRKIAVQAKGWENSVGNDAIQQVYAGMAYYVSVRW